MRLTALQQGPDGLWREPDNTRSPRATRSVRGLFSRLLSQRRTEPVRTYRKCGNYSGHEVCNWMVPTSSEQVFCTACRHNQMIPNLARAGNLDKWFRIERSKRRLFYSLLRLGLPLRTRLEDPVSGLAFAFLSSQDAPLGQPVLTGHAEGLITLNIDEADAAVRERRRIDMAERYRTLLGHFRHEIGHYYWNVLIRDGDRQDAFRALFGDERADYRAALDAHYANSAPPDWQDRFISAYASSHPWEDWAESWAHYLHILDTLETAEHFGVQVERRLPDGSLQQANPEVDPYDVQDFAEIMDDWLPLTFALNSLSRSMGQQDLYPFVLSGPAIEKLAFVHAIVRDCRRCDAV
jgi:hypothetical protein